MEQVTQQDEQNVIFYTHLAKNEHSKDQVYPWGFTTDWTKEAIESKVKELQASGYHDVKIGTWEDYEAANLVCAKESYKFEQPVPISAELFHDRLNVLPPARHYNYSSSEGFYVIEEITAELYSFYIRINNNMHFEVTAFRNAKMSDLEVLCQKSLN